MKSIGNDDANRDSVAARMSLAALVVAGVALWLWLHVRIVHASWGIIVPLVVALLAISVLLFPGVRRAVNSRLDRLRHPDPRSRAIIALAVAIVAGAYLAVTAYAHGRPLYPRVHDELSYLLGAQMLAHGRLWMPQHPLADFFDSFHILVRPVYASIYFPGTATLHVPATWLGLPTWLTPVVIAAGICGMTYRIATELLDGVAGLLAAFVLLANSSFRVFATLVMAQLPAALFGLLMTWAWVRWRSASSRRRRIAWAVVLGALAGWAAIIRPVDALAFALPIGLAIAWDLRRESLKTWAATTLAVVAAALPFLLVQVVFDLGVTGKALRTPYVLYLEQSQPGTVFAAGKELARPTTTTTAPSLTLPQKQIYLEEMVAQEARFRADGTLQWLIGRAAMMLWTTLPTAFLLVTVPAGIGLTLRRRGAWVLASVPLFFLAMYLFNPLFVSHYPLTVAPCVALWIVAGAAAWSRRTGPSAWLAVAIAAVCIAALPEVNPAIHDAADPMPLLEVVEDELGSTSTSMTIDGPSVVLFRFDPRTSVHEEPVYNSTVAWPDDAPIIRAHDLGPRNAELFAYYGARSPQRKFYLFDRGAAFDGNPPLVRLGTAAEAAQRLAAYNDAHAAAPAAK